MLASIIGDIRVGKTLFSTILAKHSIRKHIYANFHLNLPNFILLEDPEDLYQIENDSDIFLDEAYTWLESRSHGRKINKYISYILFQSGKRNIDFYLTAQLFSTVDVRFRDMSNIVIEVYKYTEFDLFEYNFYQRQRGELIFINTWYLPLEIAEKYFQYYDTYEIVEPYGLDDMETSMLMESGKKLYQKALEITNKIKPNLTKFTHDSIKFELLKQNINQKYEKYIYLILNNKKEIVSVENKNKQNTKSRNKK